MKKAFLEADEGNRRFHALLEGEMYRPPLPAWDDDGVRVMAMRSEVEVGDVEVKESRFQTIQLLHQIATGIVEVIRVFTGRPAMQAVLSPSLLAQRSSQGMGSMGSQALNSQTMGSQALNSQTMGSQALNSQTMGSQTMNSINSSQTMNSINSSQTMNSINSSQTINPSQTMNPMNSTQPSQPSLSIPFPEPFVDLILRYLIAIFDCGDLFQVDESRTKEQVGLTATSHRQLDKRIQHFAEVISELPGDVKRRVLSCSFPHLYKCMQKNPLLLEFVRHIVEQSQSLQYTSVVLIDFIANHLKVRF